MDATLFPETAARLEAWKRDPAVLGVLLVGSRSRAHADELSDDDLEVLLNDTAFSQKLPTECGELLFGGAGETRRLIYDVQYTAFTSLAQKRASSLDLDHWPYERAQVLFDRTGHLAPTVTALATMEPAFRHTRLLHATIDTGASARRAIKTYHRGAHASARLLVARGAKALSRLLFALEWRWVPLDHWLEAELLTLQDPTAAAPLLCDALLSGNPQSLLQALDGLEERLALENVPRPEDRLALFYELLHASRSSERAIHGV